MLAVWIIGGVLVLLVALLLCPAHVKIGYENSLSVQLRWLFLHFTFPREVAEGEEPVQQQEQPQQQNSNKSSALKELWRQKGPGGLLELLRRFTQAAAGPVKKLLSHILLYQLELKIVVAEEDAAQTAVRYGYACSVVYTAMGALAAITGCKNHDISVTADFDAQQGHARLMAKLKIRPLFVLTAGVSFALRYIGSVVAQKRKEAAQSS